MILFFDTETTGKLDFKADMTAVEQPNLVQIAALLQDVERRMVGQINFIIKPQGWVITAEVAAIHGITNDRAILYGVPIKTALSAFNSFCENASILVAHNLQFDYRIMTTAYFRAGIQNPMFFLEKFCTMTAATDICKLPGNYGKYKWPKLSEAHRHFFGSDFEGAHDAMNDVNAMIKVYWQLRDGGR